MSSAVTRVPAATPRDAQLHFLRRLSFETDCWDVHHSISNNRKDFVLLDVRGEEYFAAGHILAAVNLPNWKINESTLVEFPEETKFVVYCAGPHCNGANKGALALAKLGYSVKEMIGGAIGWVDEGFVLVTGDASNTFHTARAQHESK